MEVLLYEFKDGLNNYLTRCSVSSGVKSLSDLIIYNESHKTEIMPWFGQEILKMAEKKGPLSESIYKSALKKSRKLSRRKGIDLLLKNKHLDVLVAPSGGPAWKIDLVTGDHYSIGSSSPAAVSGYPNITVPAGLVHNLPVGISFFGKANSDYNLIRIASLFEEISNFRRIPEFIHS
jgi:amidase